MQASDLFAVHASLLLSQELYNESTASIIGICVISCSGLDSHPTNTTKNNTAAQNSLSFLPFSSSVLKHREQCLFSLNSPTEHRDWHMCVLCFKLVMKSNRFYEQIVGSRVFEPQVFSYKSMIRISSHNTVWAFTREGHT